MYPAASAAYPKSIGFWQAMLMIQAFSSSVISAFLPRPGEFQEKKKEQEAAKPDPDADYVDDDEVNITGTFTPLVRIEETIVPD